MRYFDYVTAEQATFTQDNTNDEKTNEKQDFGDKFDTKVSQSIDETTGDNNTIDEGERIDKCELKKYLGQPKQSTKHGSDHKV